VIVLFWLKCLLSFDAVGGSQKCHLDCQNVTAVSLSRFSQRLMDHWLMAVKQLYMFATVLSHMFRWIGSVLKLCGIHVCDDACLYRMVPILEHSTMKATIHCTTPRPPLLLKPLCALICYRRHRIAAILWQRKAVNSLNVTHRGTKVPWVLSSGFFVLAKHLFFSCFVTVLLSCCESFM